MRIKIKTLNQILSALLAALLLFHPYLGVRALAEGELTEPQPEVTAENNQTGTDADNTAEAQADENTTVNNDNNAEVENNLEVESNTGDNTVSTEPLTADASSEPTPTPSPSADACSTACPELSPTPSAEPTITPELVVESPTPSPCEEEDSASDSSASPENSSSEPEPLTLTEEVAIDGSTGDGVVAENQNTGDNSNNESLSLDGEGVVVNNENQAEIKNDLVAEGITGENTIEGEDSKIETGNAVAEANLVNVVNTNLVGSDFWQAIINLFEDSQENIDLTQIEGIENLDLQLISVLAQNFNTGSDSTNFSLALLLSLFAVYNENTATLTNNVDLLAASGQNQIVGEDGTIKTGNAEAYLNLFNMVNTNLIGSDWFFGIINLFGQLQGDIILPYELQFLYEDNQGLSPYATISAANAETGDGSENQAVAGTETTLEISNFNEADLTNNVSVSANSGENEIIGDGEIQTGNAEAKANLLNLVNTNIFGSNWLLLVINNFGDWVGNLSGWWGNTLTIGKTTFAWIRLPGGGQLGSNGVTASNENTGEGSVNEAMAQQINSVTIENTNIATVSNNLSVVADSGNNSIEGESASIQTGNATARANLFNFINTNIIGNHWFFGVINIFDQFMGNIIFPRPDLIVSKGASQATLKPGEQVAFSLNYQNSGRLWAKDVVVTDILPAGMIFLSASDGGVYQNGQVIWQLGKIESGQGGSLGVVVQINPEIAQNGELVNIAQINTSTAEPNQDNNRSSAGVVIAVSSSSSSGSGSNNSSGGENGSSSSGVGGSGDSSQASSAQTTTALASSKMTGFSAGALGAQTETGELGEALAEEGAVAGAQDGPVCWGWLVLPLAGGGLLGAYYGISGKQRRKFWWLVPIGTAALVFLGDQYLAHRFFTPSHFCQWTWLGSLLAAAVPTGPYLWLTKK